MLSPSQFSEIREPIIPRANVNVVLPDLNTLKSIIERSRVFSECIIFKGNNNGKLAIASETDAATLETYFSGLTNPKIISPEDTVEPASQESEAFSSVRVDSKHLVHFAAATVVNPSQVICSMYKRFSIYTTKVLLRMFA